MRCVFVLDRYPLVGCVTHLVQVPSRHLAPLVIGQVFSLVQTQADVPNGRLDPLIQLPTLPKPRRQFPGAAPLNRVLVDDVTLFFSQAVIQHAPKSLPGFTLADHRHPL